MEKWIRERDERDVDKLELIIGFIIIIDFEIGLLYGALAALVLAL